MVERISQLLKQVVSLRPPNLSPARWERGQGGARAQIPDFVCRGEGGGKDRRCEVGIPAIRAWIVGCLLANLMLGFHAEADTAPQSVLVLDQSVPVWPFSQRFLSRFRTALNETSKSPVNIYAESLDLGRFGSPQHDLLLSEYIERKYRDKKINVIVALGDRAVELLSRLDLKFSSTVPVVFTSFQYPNTKPSRVHSPSMTGTHTPPQFANLLRGARAVVPELKRLVIVGEPFERQPFRRHYRKEFETAANDLEVIDLSGLSLTDVKARVANLADDTAILYSVIYTDGAGIQHNPEDALRSVSEAANRPIVVDADVSVGIGAAGGFVSSPEDAADESVGLVARILLGESVASIPVTVRDIAKPVFDARQLKRWNIAEASLPAGSEIRFRENNLWQQYRWQIVLVAAILIAQGALIVWLVIERRRRHRAQRESRRYMIQAAQMNRALTAGTLSATIAHELNQPLAAILSNAEAAEIMLAAPAPDIIQLREILADIRRDDQLAAQIITRLRKLLQKGDLAIQDVDLGRLIGDTVEMIRPVAKDRNVELIVDHQTGNLHCRADPVHLQQVLLNLTMNAMDAMRDAIFARRLIIRTAAKRGSEVLVSISDNGIGIPADKLEHIFEPLVTTKTEGTGLGLAIADTIIKAYGGKIWAENRHGGGAVFYFTLERAV